jgi:hypothetical protein
MCPAHGPRASKDLLGPLLDLTKDLGHEIAGTTDADGNVSPATFHKGYWVLRNMGGIFDALHNMTKDDGLVPSCDYCAKRKTQSQAAGSLNPELNANLRASCNATLERSKSIECTGKCSNANSFNRFTMVKKGLANCFENW